MNVAANLDRIQAPGEEVRAGGAGETSAKHEPAKSGKKSFGELLSKTVEQDTTTDAEATPSDAPKVERANPRARKLRVTGKSGEEEAMAVGCAIAQTGQNTPNSTPMLAFGLAAMNTLGAAPVEPDATNTKQAGTKTADGDLKNAHVDNGRSAASLVKDAFQGSTPAPELLGSLSKAGATEASDAQPNVPKSMPMKLEELFGKLKLAEVERMKLPQNLADIAQVSTTDAATDINLDAVRINPASAKSLLDNARTQTARNLAMPELTSSEAINGKLDPRVNISAAHVNAPAARVNGSAAHVSMPAALAAAPSANPSANPLRIDSAASITSDIAAMSASSHVSTAPVVTTDAKGPATPEAPKTPDAPATAAENTATSRAPMTATVPRSFEAASMPASEPRFQVEPRGSKGLGAPSQAKEAVRSSEHEAVIAKESTNLEGQAPITASALSTPSEARATMPKPHMDVTAFDDSRDKRLESVEHAVNRMTLRQSVRADVDVPELGRIAIGVNEHRQALDIHLHAEVASTARQLEQRVSELAADVQNAQVRVGKVTVDGPSGDSPRFTSDSSSSRQFDRQPREERHEPEPREERAPQPAPRRAVRIVL